MIKSFSGQVVFCFAILRGISAYFGENWLSQYTFVILCNASMKRQPAATTDTLPCTYTYIFR